MEECLSKLWSYQPQSSAQGGREGEEVGEWGCSGDREGEGSENVDKETSPSSQTVK